MTPAVVLWDPAASVPGQFPRAMTVYTGQGMLRSGGQVTTTLNPIILRRAPVEQDRG